MKLERQTARIMYFRTLLESGMAFLGVFLTIFIFKKLGTVELALVGNYFMYLGIFFSFPVFCYFYSKTRKSLQIVFTLGIFFAILSFLFLLLGYGKNIIFTFLFFYGIGQGFLWVGIHSTELYRVIHEEKEKYISTVGFLRKSVSVVIPLLLSLLFYIFGDITYFLIFFCSAVLFLFSSFLSKGVLDYIPNILDFSDIKHFWSSERDFSIHLYYFLEGFTHMLSITLTPLAAYLILKTETNVGLLTGIASFCSMVLMYLGINFRSKFNKSKTYIFTSLLFLPFILQFAFFPNLSTFLIYTVASLIFIPQLSVSSHNVALYTMHLEKREGKDFFGNMVFRELNIFIGRTVSFIMFLIILIFQDKSLFVLSYAFLLLALVYISRGYTGSVILKKVS